MRKLPATEDNPENNQQNQNQNLSQNTRQISVYVVDKETGNNIPNANVSVGSLSGVTGTGGGQAKISDVPDGEQTIIASATGYKTGSIDVTVSSDNKQFTVELEPEASP